MSENELILKLTKWIVLLQDNCSETMEKAYRNTFAFGDEVTPEEENMKIYHMVLDEMIETKRDLLNKGE